MKRKQDEDSDIIIEMDERKAKKKTSSPRLNIGDLEGEVFETK